MNKKSYTAKEIAEIISGEIVGDASRTVTGVASIKDATAEQVSFIGNRKYRNQLEKAKAGRIVVKGNYVVLAILGDAIVVEDEGVDAADHVA